MPTESSIQKYSDLIKNLLPKGRAWDFANQKTLSDVIKVLATEFCRDDERILDLLRRESDPRLTVELLPEWENMVGLPNACSLEGLTPEQRRAQVVQRLTAIGALSKEFYDSTIAELGFTGEANNDLNFVAGRGTVGQALTNYFNDTFEVGETVGEPLAVVGWRFFWTVQALESEATTETLEVGEPIGGPLKTVRNELLECTINKLKPAHTAVRFIYT